MAFEPNYEKVVSSFRVKLGSTQSIVECKLPLNDGNGLVKVLCANAKAYISNSEIISKEVAYNGYVGFQVVYVDETGLNQGMDYTAEFKDTFGLENETQGVPIIECGVVDVKYNIVGGEVRITAVIETHIDAIVNTSLNVLVGFNDEKTFVKNEMLDYYTFMGTASERFEVGADFEIKDSVQKILSLCPSVYIEKVSLNNKFLTINGGLLIDVSYISDEDKSILRTYKSQINFTQEVANENINDDSVVQSVINVMLNDIKVTTSLDANSAMVNAVIPLQYSGFVMNKNSIDVVTDIFNLNNELNVNYESVELFNSLNSDFYEEKISGETTIDETLPFIDEVSGVCSNNVIVANTRVIENGILVEGIASTSVLYYNRELNTTTSVEVEIPFSKELDYKNIPADYVPVISVAFGDVDAKGKRGKEIEINGRLYFFVQLYKNDNGAVISAVEIQDEKIEDDCVLSIYIVKDGDTIWDIAKEMSVSPDMILEQNPDLELPLKAGDKVVVYKPKEVCFN